MQPDADYPDEFATLWFLIRRVAGLMDRAGERLFQRELGISLAQFLVLSVVDAHPGDLNQQLIADRLGLTKGTVSRQIERAVEAGRMSVEVSSRNRRENQVSLTPTGTALVRRGDARFDAERGLSFSALNDDDVQATLRTLTAVRSLLEGER